MAIDESTLAGWTGPSSDTEKDKQDRTLRMVTAAIDGHPAFKGSNYSVYAKGSYPNETNVRTDSDVDIVVHCHEARYYELAPGCPTLGLSSYSGIWTPTYLRKEVVTAIKNAFPKDQVDTSGSTAVTIRSSSARVDADVVPSFDFRYYFSPTSFHEGTRIFTKAGGAIKNYPAQHLTNGNAKNSATSTVFKKAVRILKRVENDMVAKGIHGEVASYFVECLVYNCPNDVFAKTSWRSVMQGVLHHIYTHTKGAEPTDAADRFLEVNRCKWLFANGQPWTRAEANAFAYAAYNHIGYK